MSDKYKLNCGDIKRVVVNFAFYNVPMWMLSFLTLIGQGVDVKTAALSASVTLMTALVDLGRKYLDGEKND